MRHCCFVASQQAGVRHGEAEEDGGRNSPSARTNQFPSQADETREAAAFRGQQDPPARCCGEVAEHVAGMESMLRRSRFEVFRSWRSRLALEPWHAKEPTARCE